jgi:hypothetical protein
MVMTAVLGIGAFAGLVCTLFGIGWERVGRDHRFWLWFVVGFLLLVGAVYGYWYVVVWQTFPDGYVITYAPAGSIMQLPAFLKRDLTQEPPFLEDGGGRSRGYAVRGCLIGASLAVLFWFVPIPVAIVVWIFGLSGPFVDHMLMAIPFFVALPIIGAGVGELYGHFRRFSRQR